MPVSSERTEEAEGQRQERGVRDEHGSRGGHVAAGVVDGERRVAGRGGEGRHYERRDLPLQVMSISSSAENAARRDERQRGQRPHGAPRALVAAEVAEKQEQGEVGA